MNLKNLNNWPSDKATKRLIYLGFVVLWINFPIIVYFSVISNYPATFLESQLSFSGAVIKSHFKGMSAEDLHYYRLSQLCDIVFDFCRITIFFGLTLFLVRKFDEDSGWRQSGLLIAILGVIGAICDVIENILIIMMTTNPQGFPDSWAVAHSWFATVKFILWGIQDVWIICADVKLFKNHIIRKEPFLAAIGVIVSQSYGYIPVAIIMMALGII